MHVLRAMIVFLWSTWACVLLIRPRISPQNTEGHGVIKYINFYMKSLTRFWIQPQREWKTWWTWKHLFYAWKHMVCLCVFESKWTNFTPCPIHSPGAVKRRQVPDMGCTSWTLLARKQDANSNRGGFVRVALLLIKVRPCILSLHRNSSPFLVPHYFPLFLHSV